ncbi:hypothetical protein KP509_14G030100 [Ceratopteris richardii]|uniref:Anaphase-promoting complex subunit 4-like WD40 domain-containing protein n=2 Tax=Ceratopteris richardii TaxID=49495 RepID=A0A8T2TDG3_CERRI|nr:hypothetical protein KP509_14G030100 [Ceratopteris richardii]
MGGRQFLTCARKYDLPLFCCGWATTAFPTSQKEEKDAEGNEGKSSGSGSDTSFVIFGGGGGDSGTGITNNLLLARFDHDTNTLSEAVHILSTSDDPPYRMAVQPTGHGIVCSFTQSCRLFEIKANGPEPDIMKLEPANKVLTQLQDVGQQRSLVFSADGTRFAAGGDNGHLRVFEWPSLKLVLDQPEAHKSIRDVDFSLDSAFLASTGGSGPCRIWDLSTMATVASLSLDQGGDLGFCRFSRDGTNPLLFVAVKEGDKGSIAFWNTNNWRKVGVKKFQESPISAFAMSCDGKYLAIGSSEGDISIISVEKMTVQQRVKNAHMIFVTSMEFSRDCRALLSVSADSSARVTVIEEVQKEAMRLHMLIFILLVIIFVIYLAKDALWDHQEETLRTMISQSNATEP